MEISIGIVLLISLIILGLTLVYSGELILERKCPDPVIEYRFIPRTFAEEAENPVITSDLFKNLFFENSLNI